MTVKDSKGRKGKTKPASPSKSSSQGGGSNGGGAARAGGRRHRGGEVGAALRSVYDRAVREEIPPEMLDLLGKLG